MKRILIDTNSYAAFKRDNPIAVNTLKMVEYIGVNIIVLGEILSGFKGGSKEAKNREELEQFLDSPRVHVVQMDEETAEFYAKIYWDLKKKGKPIPTNDIWVAASAMRHGLALFTFDGHFNDINGLLLL
ncbi:MAG: VapC toxin family PIN domain ribonuclease [Nitrospirae bacterium CG_4_10_14_0_8_um_filter_41_23]|nr:MAG: VapC toxin family PIN domain ribonuclease [Nitrospirae bacterium CG11_big_fil_rev_8_21_14_0_20_41_14]PIW86661.1 MAG: VapC toxin family PIN domain ribonuclease [Nitrospirae bacterium CG_4_8_14_3_um_filter_41_47]PIY85983.1 MAG: VapC toxin family PIN domain ribonuclease [Nitrospirae bacterium CG_4_10_14_0_8_um_filter_41_23]PJA80383.1 MAG: VapC toxin family PIN domain ribonuclease [Nitrospirae bacterium CG_4_9_14_3_um_filter_41_27]